MARLTMQIAIHTLHEAMCKDMQSLPKQSETTLLLDPISTFPHFEHLTRTMDHTERSTTDPINDPVVLLPHNLIYDDLHKCREMDRGPGLNTNNRVNKLHHLHDNVTWMITIIHDPILLLPNECYPLKSINIPLIDHTETKT